MPWMGSDCSLLSDQLLLVLLLSRFGDAPFGVSPRVLAKQSALLR